MQVTHWKNNIEEVHKWGEDFIKGLTLKQIAEKYNANYKTICNNLIQLGYRTPTKKYVTRKIKEVTYFDKIDSWEKAYFLGLMYSDGYIGKSTYSSFFGIALQLQDDYIIKTFAEQLNITSKPKIYKNSIKINVPCTHCVESLQKLGVKFNKSHTDYDLPPIEDKYMDAFICGYFDGDGCITIKSTGYSVVSFYGNSEYFLIKLKDYLETKGIMCRPVQKQERARINPIYVLYLSKKENQLKFADYIYKNASIFLTRKNKKFMQIPR